MVETSSPSCPRCRVESPTQSWVQRNIAWLVLGVGVAVGAGVLLTRGGTPTTADDAPAAPATAVYHAGDTTDVRSGPGPEHPAAYGVAPGATLHVYESDAEWLPVASGEAATDTAGYVSRQVARPGPAPALLVMRHDTTRREGNLYVVGLARNMTDDTFSYAMIQIVELKNGQMLGVGGIANINNLAPHATWQWHALLSADSADTYQIFDVNVERARRPSGS
jgi:hypothetical protein